MDLVLSVLVDSGLAVWAQLAVRDQRDYETRVGRRHETSSRWCNDC